MENNFGIFRYLVGAKNSDTYHLKNYARIRRRPATVAILFFFFLSDHFNIWPDPSVLAESQASLAGILPERQDPSQLAGIWPRQSAFGQLAGILPFCARFRRFSPESSTNGQIRPLFPVTFAGCAKYKKNIFILFYINIFYVVNKI